MELSPNLRKIAAALGFVTLSGCAGLDIRDNGNLSVRNAPEHSGPKDFGSEACQKAGIDVYPAQSMNGLRSYYPSIYRAWQTSPKEVVVTSNVTGRGYVMASSGIDLRLGELFAAGVTSRAIVQNERHRGGGRSTWEAIRDGAKAGVAISISTSIGRAFDDAFGSSGAAKKERCMADIMAGAYDGYTYNNQGATVKFQQPVRSVYGNQYQGQPGTQYDWYQQRSDELNLRR